MRIHRLDLIRYGKFTDRSVALPAAGQDFHLIVGPNEAGKSTFRAAILDLLFGIQTRSTYAFQHLLSELRLGASIGEAGTTFEFQRAKGQKQTLRTPQNAVLADNALTPFLGTADRAFFDQMFGLDHGRLIKGGNSILNAEDGVGQILFQSAAGVASLGKMRDALAAEADKLWSTRKSGEREYYIAADKLDAAAVALKDATVRTKAWAEAHARVDQLVLALDTVLATHRQRQIERNRIERIRRAAPFREALREYGARLAALGTVVLLPADAAMRHAEAERALSTARQLHELRTTEVDRATEAMSMIVQDHAVLALAAEVTVLAEQRLQYGAHVRDIALREAEVSALCTDVCNACIALGWPVQPEAALRQRLPTLLVRRDLGQRMREASGLQQSLQAAQHAQRTKAGEIAMLVAQLGEARKIDIPAALRAALSEARNLGDHPGNLQRLAAITARDAAALETALQALQPWRMSVPMLRAMTAPSSAALLRATQDTQGLAAQQKTAHARIAAEQAESGRIMLAIRQFRALHHPVTQDDVLQARAKRECAWAAIRRGTVTLESAAMQYQAAVAHADATSDQRLDNVEEATALQALEHELERADLRLSVATAQGAADDQAMAAGSARWAATTAGLGLPGMTQDEFPDWLSRRQKALDAARHHDDSMQALAQMQASVEAATHALYDELTAGLAPPVPGAPAPGLTALTIQAERIIAASDDARVRHDTLSRQAQAAQAQAVALQQAVEHAQSALSTWRAAWSTLLAKAGLPQDCDVATAEGALELLAAIERQLDEMRTLRVERIDAMQNDLVRFGKQAQRLAVLLEPGMPPIDPNALSHSLTDRLDRARKAQAEHQRLNATRQAASREVAQAEEAMRTAIASVAPLMARAGTDSHAALAECIVRSDQMRYLQAQAEKAQASLLEAGDGMTRQAIEDEVDSADLSAIAAEMETINMQLADAVQQQSGVSTELADARRTLAAIEGSANAAQAEARRQEALAEMSDAAERYVKVHTAQRLLRWSIERYRERKQGPMLAHASTIFSRQTLGSFQALVVDFDKVPMTLEGKRADGSLVGIGGMSDGTRDQLYLALRLAALELHLEQVAPLPFIADDLFINYDDARSVAGLQALATLSQKTQVIFLTHHDHLIDSVRSVFGSDVNVVWLADQAGPN